jgi:hypothetical protein
LRISSAISTLSACHIQYWQPGAPVTYHEVHRGPRKRIGSTLTLQDNGGTYGSSYCKNIFPAFYLQCAKSWDNNELNVHPIEWASRSVCLCLRAAHEGARDFMNYGLQFVESWQNDSLLCDLTNDSTSSKEYSWINHS